MVTIVARIAPYPIRGGVQGENGKFSLEIRNKRFLYGVYGLAVIRPKKYVFRVRSKLW